MPPSPPTPTQRVVDLVVVNVNFEQSAYTVAESDDSSTTEVEEHKVEVKVTPERGPRA